MTAFIETQFPIARLSAESYKERKANNGQTLTRLGKWWGRKPLILVRAAILGMLMPASADAKKDREVFLQILTMDDDGAWQRCKPPAQRKLGRAAFDALTYAERIALCERPENVAPAAVAAWTKPCWCSAWPARWPTTASPATSAAACSRWRERRWPG